MRERRIRRNIVISKQRYEIELELREKRQLVRSTEWNEIRDI